MDNILLIFLNELENIDEFNEIIDKFAEKNYFIYLLDNIREDETFSIDLLPGFVDFYKSQHESENKVVVLSNSRDLMFSWYRCFNSLVDDFIYFVDKDDKNYFQPSDRHFDFYRSLFEFDGIEGEILNGKIYLNKDVESSRYGYMNIHFNNIEKFDYEEKAAKSTINKKYIFAGYEYIFNVNSNNSKFEFINLHGIKMDNKDKNSLKIIIIKGQSQYDVLRVMSDKLANEFKRLECSVTIIDLLDKKWIHDLNAVINEKYDFIFSYNAIGIDLRLNNNQFLSNAMEIPFIAYIVDHPVSHHERISESIDKCLYIFSDEENLKYMNDKFSNKCCSFIPLMGIESPSTNSKKFSSREIDVLFAGSIQDPNVIKKNWNNYSENLKIILEETVEKFLMNESVFLWDLVDKSTEKYMKDNNTSDILNLKRTVFYSAETYIRTLRRYQVLKSIANSKLDVVCFTNNIEELKRINKNNNLIIKEKISFNELLKQMKNSKIVLNISAQASLGVSERVTSAMINGAVSLTDSNEYIKKVFKEREDILLYNKKNIDNIPDIIECSLKDINKLENIAQYGNQKVKKYCSPKTTALEILNLYYKYF